MVNYRNITTAINQELGRIAGVQHHAWGIRNPSGNGERSVYETPLEFEVWFQRGLKVYESKGFKFQWLNLTTLKVTMPNGRTGTRDIDDFFDEYKNEYRKQFPNCN